jgi:AcrR family transcriptional regulator
VATRAKASNETLYRWYGDKGGLARALVERNARAARAALDAALADGDEDPLKTLGRVAPILLGLVLSERAAALNRAAAADSTGELGRAIGQAGRGAIEPRIEALAARAIKADLLRAPDAAQAADRYLALLIGDAQIRRVIGVDPEPSDDEIRARAARGFKDFLELCGAERPPPPGRPRL